ncbi:unnamed protein product [Polarella glacialis]|uniref:Uncharacterized protein n=1 Tax=Polarella glacialis TaxID=89957 RepID=A0A813E2G2_POLGL|nr:unnamed protein product [Polarella glacialis]
MKRTSGVEGLSPAAMARCSLVLLELRASVQVEATRMEGCPGRAGQLLQARDHGGSAEPTILLPERDVEEEAPRALRCSTWCFFVCCCCLLLLLLLFCVLPLL